MGVLRVDGHETFAVQFGLPAFPARGTVVAQQVLDLGLVIRGGKENRILPEAGRAMAAARTRSARSRCPSCSNGAAGFGERPRYCRGSARTTRANHWAPGRAAGRSSQAGRSPLPVAARAEPRQGPHKSSNRRRHRTFGTRRSSTRRAIKGRNVRGHDVWHTIAFLPIRRYFLEKRPIEFHRPVIADVLADHQPGGGRGRLSRLESPPKSER